MLKSVLVANRGEIACRVIRAAHKLGMRATAVYSDADASAPHVKMADAAIGIGPAPARDSYLDIEKIVAAAKRAGVDCVHPGYGFLSENAEFAEACAREDLVFVGPPPSAMRAMGLKDAAKALMERVGVPVTPGYHGAAQDEAILSAEAGKIGFPVLIKAVAGGGGKGMRRVDHPEDFNEALAGARREAEAAFNNGRVLIEKFIENPRHIEIQVFADAHGNVVHLNERDCSLQRRHQKVIEEAPAPGMTPETRGKMGAAAVAAARAVAYVGAGTVEFIVDGAAFPDGGFWFMEMNTRLQVEHPVTEAVTGVDLVEWQFRVAAGERLPLLQSDIHVDGHAVEARLYAEDPTNGFLPSTGKLWGLTFAEGAGIRVDAGVCSGGEVMPYYDPMIAKIVARGSSRDEALDRLSGALGRTLVAGPRTNLAFLKALCDAPGFRAEKFDTGFIDRDLAGLGAVPRDIDEYAGALAVARHAKRLFDEALDTRARGGGPLSPWDEMDLFQLGGGRTAAFMARVDGRDFMARVEFGAMEVGCSIPNLRVRLGGAEIEPIAPLSDNEWIVEAEDNTYLVLRAGFQTRVEIGVFDAAESGDAGDAVVSPMHGKLTAVFVDAGARVRKGQRVAIVEAMKMEHPLVAPVSGVVAEIRAAPGAQVARGAVVLLVEPDSGGAE